MEPAPDERPPLPPDVTPEEFVAYIERYGRPMPPHSDTAIPDLTDEEWQSFEATIRDA